MTAHRTLQLDNLEEARLLFGKKDRNLHRIRDRFDVRISARNGVLRIEGREPSLGEASSLVAELLDQIRDGVALSDREIEARIERDAPAESEADGRPASPTGRGGVRVERARVEPRTPGQRRYFEALDDTPIVFCIGPAGTGKTYLAVAAALRELGRGAVGRIVLARPAVEAGETLGFLPGDFQAKIHPYLRPLYDALFSMVDPVKMRRYIDKELIEIVPLAYMRGRTLDNAFIILDEGQNTTPKQMKMFLTRMGGGSRIVVTGDITQVDLPPNVPSGLIEARRILEGVAGVRFVDLGPSDIVRHPIVQHIVERFNEREVPDAREPHGAPELERRDEPRDEGAHDASRD